MRVEKLIREVETCKDHNKKRQLKNLLEDRLVEIDTPEYLAKAKKILYGEL